MDERVYLWRRVETIMNTSYAREWKQTPTEQEQEKQVAVKVHKQNWVTKGEKVLYSVVGAVLIATGFFIVSYSSSTDVLNSNLQKLEQNVLNQQSQNEVLLFEIEELSRPTRITQIASEYGLKTQNAEVKLIDNN